MAHQAGIFKRYDENLIRHNEDFIRYYEDLVAEALVVITVPKLYEINHYKDVMIK